ncbi:MAG: DUF975 family protein [Clostridiales bacterium]|nr:DUF975 family protein [Clostridiales bacterium]
MFGIGSFYFKMKAKAALKGNWQTAMLVTFFSGVFTVALQVFQSRFLQLDVQQIEGLMMVRNYEELWPLFGLNRKIIYGFLGLSLLSLLMSPALTLGCNHYFIQRLRKEELGFGGLFSRFCIFFKALWLNILIAVKTLLWGLVVMGPFLALLFLVPQVSVFLLKNPFLVTVVSVVASIPPILAALRYAMATFIVADKPDVGAWKAIEQSKQMMKTMKMNYLALNISFVGWLLLSSLLGVLLGPVVGMIAQLFMETWVGAYMNGAFASFYQVVADEDGLMNAARDLHKMMQNAGVNFPDAEAFAHPEEVEELQPEESGEAEETVESAPDEDRMN